MADTAEDKEAFELWCKGQAAALLSMLEIGAGVEFSYSKGELYLVSEWIKDSVRVARHSFPSDVVDKCIALPRSNEY